MKRIIRYITCAFILSAAICACSKEHMTDVNTDKSKPSSIDPNTQLTTALLQTYGDFGMMDTYRSYITGFTQHMAGSWNVSNYGGSVHAQDDQMSLIWDKLYAVAIKNLVDGISRTDEDSNINGALRTHRAYLMSVLTDTYGDVPCSEAGLGYLEHIANPKYDRQEDIYNWLFTELEKSIESLAKGTDRVYGDVSSYNGDAAKWAKYANSLRMRFAMRISDVNPAKAKEEFEKSLKASCGYISSASEDMYIKYMNAPFTLYDGSRDLDFRANALGEILYGQDFNSPSHICATFYDILNNSGDPRLFRYVRHYNNVLRSQISADDQGNIDLTEEFHAYLKSINAKAECCKVGAAWYDEYPANIPSVDAIPTLKAAVEANPGKGLEKSDPMAHLTRPSYAIAFEKADCPGMLMTYAEVEYLLAEAKTLGWNVSGEAAEHYYAGVRASMQQLNSYYSIDPIQDSEIEAYINANPFNAAKAREQINTQAWILHIVNPNEAWANMRRSDYPVLVDRTQRPKFKFTYDDPDLSTPNRLRYPLLEMEYNSASYQEALERLGGKDDWHKRVWWDTADGHFE
ncbi:MAG: SusD/RagB family nutrient-binding outer membrane lipoprotein [Bacteroidales bacterium]|nr:SusD/RagB family nutrient-binding outer membrane lipoprotein [Bacteroidales bacterium]